MHFQPKHRLRQELAQSASSSNFECELQGPDSPLARGVNHSSVFLESSRPINSVPPWATSPFDIFVISEIIVSTLSPFPPATSHFQIVFDKAATTGKPQRVHSLLQRRFFVSLASSLDSRRKQRRWSRLWFIRTPFYSFIIMLKLINKNELIWSYIIHDKVIQLKWRNSI